MKNQALAFAEYTQTPWGRMYYEMVWQQLPLPGEGLRVLDYGSGTGVNAAHYALRHQVTAVEPNPELIKLAVQGGYRQIVGDISALDSIEGEFDAILCHNVLEYVEDRGCILDILSEKLNPGGVLSVIKHNAPGKVMQTAVFSANPKAARELLESGRAESALFGEVGLYDSEWLILVAGERGLIRDKFLGLRAFWALIQDNDIKSDEDWREEMLALEMEVQDQSPFREVAYYHHLIFKSASSRI